MKDVRFFDTVEVSDIGVEGVTIDLRLSSELEDVGLNAQRLEIVEGFCFFFGGGGIDLERKGGTISSFNTNFNKASRSVSDFFVF